MGHNAIIIVFLKINFILSGKKIYYENKRAESRLRI
jgi:hypothetical protein